ncbi:hypothetical protein ACP70R_041692 [Stipagrostis hirtigluma subsp. patula]
MEERSTTGRRLLVAALLSSIVCWGAGGFAAAAAVEVRVGVVLDLASDAGRESLACISMALEDFYVKHPSYSTRVGLHVRDSRGDPATAAHAAEDLIKNVQVQAIIVAPQTSVEADLFAQLGRGNSILVLSFSGISPTSPLYTVPFFVHTAPKDSSQAAPIASIVTSFTGHEVIMVCEDSPYGTGILQPLTDALQSNEVHTMDSVIVPIAVTDDHLDQVLYRLKETPARLFVVHMRPALAIHLFFRAKDAGMMSEAYVWIATLALGSVVDSLSPNDIDYLQGVVTLRPYVQPTRYVSKFSVWFKSRFNLDTNDVENPSMLMFWAYDTAWATATAAEVGGFSSADIRMDKKYLSTNGVSTTRRALLDSILDTAFDGLAGNFKLINGEQQQPSYEIVNITSKGATGVGLWTPLSLLPQKLSNKGHGFDNSRSDSGTVKPVFWCGDSAMTFRWREKIGFPLMHGTVPSLNPESEENNARKLVEEQSGKVCAGYSKTPLRIGVPRKDGFKSFVNISHPYSFCKDNGTMKQITGYSIDIFESAMKNLQPSLCYEFCVFNGSYDELVGNVSVGNLGGAVGDVTITADRTRKVDFTMPYTQSGVSLLVLCKNDLEPIQWTFLAPLTEKLWFATVGFFFFTGFVVWMIEKPRNPEYQGSRLRQFSNALYFAFSTLTFSHGHIIRSPLSKIVVVVWCFVVLVIVQSYTASLSSILTAERLHPSVKNLDQLLFNDDNVGYQDGSFVYYILRNRGFNKDRLISYSKEEEYAEALMKGSKNGGVSAVVDEVPFLTSFLSDTRYQNQFQIVDLIYRTPGLGFARDANAQSIENSAGAEESRPLQNGTVNLSALDQPHPEAGNDIHERGRSGGHEESRSVQNDMDNNSVRGQLLHEAISNGTQGADRSSGCAGHEELNLVQNDVSDGFARAQSFQIEINTG